MKPTLKQITDAIIFAAFIKNGTIAKPAATELGISQHKCGAALRRFGVIGRGPKKHKTLTSAFHKYQATIDQVMECDESVLAFFGEA
jgi:hypothetical protein